MEKKEKLRQEKERERNCEGEIGSQETGGFRRENHHPIDRQIFTVQTYGP